MKRILKSIGITASLLLATGLLAIGVTSAIANDVPTAGRSIEEFINPDGSFDLEAARLSGYQGSLDLEGYESAIDPVTGRPLFQPSAAKATADHPDDIYWDNSISPSLPGVGGTVYAATVFNGQLIVGGSFQVAGDVLAYRIASWDGSSWSPLGSGMNYYVNALTVYDDTLIAGGEFTIAGNKVSAYLARWTKSDPTDVVEFDPDNLPTHYNMSQSYPNPFNPITTIEFNLPKRSHVTVTIYNLLGQQVQSLVDQELSVGNYKVTWDGSTFGGGHASTGVYFYRIVTEDFTETKKMVLLK